MVTRFSYVPFFSKLHDTSALDGLLGPYAECLQRLNASGPKQASHGEAQPDDLCVWFIGTGGVERQVLQHWAERRRGPTAPILLLAHPDHNSLAAAMEVLARLQQEGASGKIVFIDGPNDPTAEQRIRDVLHELSVERTLRSVRLGLIGAPSDWLVASSPDVGVVRSVWGPSVQQFQPELLLDALARVDDTKVEPLANTFLGNATRTLEPTRSQVLDAVRVYLALRTIVDAEQLQALTVRCFDLVVQKRMTACYALAKLNEEGTIAGCEGDLTATVGMFWAKTLLGVLPWMANVARVDTIQDTLWLAHCTVPPALVRGYAIRSHFESGLGVGIEGTFATGPVTLLRIGGANLECLWVREGELIQAGQDDNLCRTQVHVRLGAGVVDEMLRAPLGNHLVVLTGHHRRRLESFWRFVIEPRVSACTQQEA